MNGSSHLLSNESHQWPKQDPPNGMQSIIQSLAALSPFRSLPSLSKHSSLPLSGYSLNDWDLSIFPAELSEDPEEETVIIKSIISYEKLIGDAKQGAKKKEKAKSMSEDHMNVFVKMLQMVFPAVTGADDPLFTDVASSYRKYLVMKALCSTFSQAVGVKSFREWLFIDADRYAQFVEFISSMWRWLSCVCRDSFQQQNTGNKKTVELWFHRNNTVKELMQWTSELIETLFVEQSNQQISQLQKSLMPLMMEVIIQKNIQKADLLTAFKQFAFTTATDANVYSVQFMKNYDVLASLFRGCIQCKNFEDFSIGVFVFRFTLAIMNETNFIVNDDDLKQMVSRIVKPSTESAQKMFSLLQTCSDNVNEEATNTEFARFIHAWMQIDQNDLLIKPSPAIFRCRVKVPDDEDQEVAIAFLFDDNFSTIHPQTGEIQVTMDNDEMKQFRQPIDPENDIVEIVMNKTMDGESKEECAQLIFNRNDHWLQPFIDVLKKIESAQAQSNDATEEDSTAEPLAETSEEDDDQHRSTTPLPMKGIEQYDASFTDDEGGDEMDSDTGNSDGGSDDEEDGFSIPKKGATKKSVPLFDLNEKKEDDAKKNEKKISSKPSQNKRKTSKQNEDEETEKKKADDDDDDQPVDDDASKKKPKKLKKDEKTPPARSSKKASDEKVDEEKKTDSGKQRPTRLTAAKANQKIRDGAKNEQKRSDDEDEQQQEKVEKEFDDDDDAYQQHKSKSTAARKRKADTTEKKPTTMKGRKPSIDQTQPQTRKSMEDTDEIKMLQPSMSSIINHHETENSDRLYPLKHTASAPPSYMKSSNNKRNQTADKFMFQQADTLDARMKISQQETVQCLSRVMENISQVFNDSDRERKQSALFCGIINKQINHMQRMMNSHHDQWKTQWEDFSNGAMRVLQITKPLLSVDSENKKRKFNIDHVDEPAQNTDDLINDRPLPKYARLNDQYTALHAPSSIRGTAAISSNTNVNPSPSLQRMLNQFIHNVNIRTPTTRPHINSGY